MTHNRKVTTYNIVHKDYPKWAGFGWLPGQAGTEAQAQRVAEEWDRDIDLARYGPHRILEVTTTTTEIPRP